MAFAVLADKHVVGDSQLHRLDPRAKLVIALSFIFCVVFVPTAHWEVFGILGVMLIAAIAASGLPPRLVLGRSLLALPFALAAVPVLFKHSGSELFEVPLVGWTATDTGVEVLASILLRSWFCVITATILTATTESDHILRSLRYLGVPKLFVSTISFMWRYVFVIGEEAQRLITAREARSARPIGQRGGSIRWRARTAGNMVGSLFLRSLNRSERVYVAMLARGYNGEARSLDRFTMTTRDIVITGVSIVAVLLVQAYARL